MEVVPPCMGSSPNSQCSLADFTFSMDGKPVACPQGHTPLKAKKKKRFSAGFASEIAPLARSRDSKGRQ